MNMLQKVADGILDSTNDYRDNIFTVGSDYVADYAENIGIDIDSTQAEKVYEVCKKWIQFVNSSEFNGEGQNEYYHKVMKELSDD